MEWWLADEKNRIREVAERGREKPMPKPQSFKEFLMSSDPSFEGVELTRDPSPMRDVTLKGNHTL